MTIPPGQLLHIDHVADTVAAIQTNFEYITREVYTCQPTLQNGVPTTIIGPPTAGNHIAGEIWRDALLAQWLCTTSGNPGSWRQISPAPVPCPPTSGNVPIGYVITDASDRFVTKRHTGEYNWEPICLPTTGGTVAGNLQVTGNISVEGQATCSTARITDLAQAGTPNISIVVATTDGHIRRLAIGSGLEVVSDALHVSELFRVGDWDGQAPTWTPALPYALAYDKSGGSLWIWYDNAWHLAYS